jgi:hypothetical protein
VDLSRWIKTEIVGSRQSRLEEGEDAMKEIKKNMGWQNDTEKLKMARSGGGNQIENWLQWGHTL